MRLIRKLFYKTYLIAFINKRDEVCLTKICASNSSRAVIKWRNNCKCDYKVIAITKISKKLGEIL